MKRAGALMRMNILHVLSSEQTRFLHIPDTYIADVPKG